MAVFEVRDKASIAPLFDGRSETFIRAYLQGNTGIAYVDDVTAPTSAQIVLGDARFFAGAANEELARNAAGEGTLLMQPDAEWTRVIEQVHPKAFLRTRYAASVLPSGFNVPKLQAIVAGLPGGYSLHQIDKAMYEQIMVLPWAKDWCAIYADFEDYKARGLGVVALKGGEIVSGASSYFSYPGGIEIQIDTREDERKKGLAAVCGAALILECLNRSLHPSWDAHDRRSLSLAEKLGYRLDHEYPAYEILAE